MLRLLTLHSYWLLAIQTASITCRGPPPFVLWAWRGRGASSPPGSLTVAMCCLSGGSSLPQPQLRPHPCVGTSPYDYLYSWIDHQLQTGLTLAFLLRLSDVKTETSFGFLGPNYTGHVVWIFSKHLNMSSLGRV